MASMTMAHDCKGQNTLMIWECCNKPLAPLGSLQHDAFLQISEEIGELHIPDNLPSGEDAINMPVSSSSNSTSARFDANDLPDQACSVNEISRKFESAHQFLMWYTTVEDELEMAPDIQYEIYHNQLLERQAECICLLEEIDRSLKASTVLGKLYELVSVKSSSLHHISERLFADQRKLTGIYVTIEKHLNYFLAWEQLSKRLNSPLLSVTSDTFEDILEQLDECIEYMITHNKWKESEAYLTQYLHCQNRVIIMMHKFVVDMFDQAMQQVLAVQFTPGDTLLALCYGKFQALAPRIKRVITQIELRTTKFTEYEHLLASCHQTYFEHRQQLMVSSVKNALTELPNLHKRDHCSLVRSGCAFIVHICHDEHHLFYQFFTDSTPMITSYLEMLCTALYDVLRPVIIHINHLETLAEICSILHFEMLEDHVQSNQGPMEAFGNVAWQLLHDVQERLVFRTHCFLQEDILHYKPSPGDLAYPEKLLMMENISQSLQEQSHRFLHPDSISTLSATSCPKAPNIDIKTIPEQPQSPTGISPANLHGMWYPTVRRVLVCLSRLYRCIDRPIFQGLSHEALCMCIQSIQYAATEISLKESPVDGELFQICHLLILREQIAAFHVDFTMKEVSLDFSTVKTAAFSLIHKRKMLFSLDTNNALLEFLLEGIPHVQEQLIDSRKEVDQQLKAACEAFIQYTSHSFVGSMIEFVQKAQLSLSNAEQKETLSMKSFASVEAVHSIVHETQYHIKSKLPDVQWSLHLYLANRENEFILFRFIKRNIVTAFEQLYNLIMNGGYTEDDIIVIGCPTREQVYILLSSLKNGNANPSQVITSNTSSSSSPGSS